MPGQRRWRHGVAAGFQLEGRHLVCLVPHLQGEVCAGTGTGRHRGRRRVAGGTGHVRHTGRTPSVCGPAPQQS